ncbi:MAG: photosystem P840 reaction-center cytochrome c-551 [Candidatus Electrothrix sp. YB6]
MNPLITSIAGLIVTLTGAWAMLLMLELRGNPRKESKANQRLIRAHKITGYIFIAFFCAIIVVMLSKAAHYQEEFSPRTILHIALGVLIIPLLAIKLLIIRRFKRLGTQVPGLGLAVFLALFVLNSITGGYYFLHHSDMRYVSLSAKDTDMLDADLGQQLVTEKCAKCHTLERVFKTFKSEQGWTDTVNRMALIDAPNIRDFDTKQIIHYLITQQKRRKKLASVAQENEKPVGKLLIEQKCSSCHEVDRIYTANKERLEWVQTVEKMIGYADQLPMLNQKEKKAVIEYLSNRNRSQSEKLLR